MLSFRQLEVFRAVIVGGSISAASQQLGIAQPTVTKMIRRLEDILDVELFDRSGGRLTPTRVAQQIFEVVNPSIAGMEQLSTTIRDIAGGREATFRLGVSPSVSQALAPKALAHFARRNPGVRLRMDTLSLKQTHDYLWLAEGDCAVTIFPVEDPRIVSSTIAWITMVCLIPADHPLAGQETVSISDIAEEPLVFFHPNTPHGLLVKQMFHARNIEPNIAIETRFAETAQHLMHEGFGIAMADELTAKGIRDENIRVVPLAGAPWLAVLLHHHKDIGSRFSVDLLRECLLEAAADLNLRLEA